MTAKLNQIIAVEKGVKSQTTSVISELHKVNQKDALFNGMHKAYQPKDDEGETLPPESKRVQYQADEVVRVLERSMSDLMSITARKDWTNCTATADVVVDGNVLLKDVPITYLLFLEKNVQDIRTFVSNIPVLDPAENWKLDKESGLYKSDPISRNRTFKDQVPIVLYDATPEHPAQTQIISKDVVVGTWTEVRSSGAMPITKKKEIAERVEKLLRAIKEAREQANVIEEVQSPDVGAAIFGYLVPQEKGAKE